MRTKHKNRFISISVIAIITAAWLLLSFYFYWLSKAQNEDYIESQDTLMLQSQNIVLDTYEKFSNYVFETIVSDKDVLSIMTEAKSASIVDQNVLRERLYLKLEKVYEISKKYDFGEIHFHLPDGTSFLRMNSPSKYGDLLNNFRYSVKVANSEFKYVSGFEEGRVFNGYRFVYPLFNKEQHVGSVEISVSVASVMKAFNKNFPTRDTSFILRKDLVENTLFEEDQARYSDSLINDNYVVDQEILRAIEPNITYGDLYLDVDFINALKHSLEPYLDKRQSFSFSIFYDRKAYLIQYFAQYNIEGIMVGYLFSIGEDSNFITMRNALSTQLFVTSVSYFIIIFILVIFETNRVKINDLALKDSLTKTYNRYSFFELAQHELFRSERNNSKTSFAMLDIDYFKTVNDTYGHGIGDDVLVELTRVVLQTIREGDIFGRYGGEEFILMMPETDLSNARIAAERIRMSIESHSFERVDKLTISVGISERLAGESVDSSIDRADLALYDAKQTGRNRVCG